MMFRCKHFFKFSIYSNQHQQAKAYVGGREVTYDTNVQRYEPTIQAYLQKRWTKKEEIPAKIYIIQGLDSIQSSLAQQTLFPLTHLVDKGRLERMYESDEISPTYLMSLFCEEHFKPMIDEYLQKVLVNGRVPPLKDVSRYQRIEEQVQNLTNQSLVRLYRTFFLGDELTDLEKEIEFRYLAFKQRKFYRFQAHQKSGDKCLWTYSQQRCLEKMVNWQARDIDMYDYQRPVYDPLCLDKLLPIHYLLFQINGISIWKRVFFELFEKARYQRTKKQLEWVITINFTRLILYTHSNQFLRGLHIPADFHIEHSIVNMHVWLIIDRLNKINTPQSIYASKILDQVFKKYTQNQIGKIHLRKKNDFIKDVDQYMKTSRKYLHYHFNRNPRTIVNNYIKLDALVWSIVFFEKIPRYSNRVYLMAEYLKVNYDYLSTLTYEKFLDADIQFDIFKMSLDFKDRLLAFNPPLSETEFLEEFQSDQPKKKYYYSYDEPENFKMPIEKPRYFERTVNQKRVESLNKSILTLYKKYYNLSNYDHFTNLEEQQQQLRESKKYIWNQNQESDDIEDIRKIYHLRKQQD